MLQDDDCVHTLGETAKAEARRQPQLCKGTESMSDRF